MSAPTQANISPACGHCGDSCGDAAIAAGKNTFCCNGCQLVYEILHDNDLTEFYRLDPQAGRSQRQVKAGDYDWLSEERLAARLARYRDPERWRVELELPAIHCISCVWLLEQLSSLLPGVLESRVDVTRKLATVDFDPRFTKLRALAELLARLGYPPVLRTADREERTGGNRPLLYRIGVAGFCFGNIMLFSFPEYLGLGADLEGSGFGRAMGLLMLALSLPVVAYAGQDFLWGAWRGVRARRFTIDLPIAIGMVALFGRSAFEILTGSGAGYLDSLAGLVFFLLIGRWFQAYTFERLSFDRDHRDYFPIGAYREAADGQLHPVACEELSTGDRLLVRPGQVIPVDGILLDSNTASIDYSFVTGEARPRPVRPGSEVFAGGRATSSALRLQVTQPASRSYLLRLWQGRHERDMGTVEAPEGLIRYFTIGILSLALATFFYWYGQDAGLAYRAATAVLIIACPCALALATPFAYGTLQRLMGRAGCYLRGPVIISRLAEATAFVFDKTGTLIESSTDDVLELPEAGLVREVEVILGMARQSAHPVSKNLVAALLKKGVDTADIPAVTEAVGEGLSLRYRGREYRIGRAAFCGLTGRDRGTYASVDEREILRLRPASPRLRPGAGEAIRELSERGEVYLLSGDAPPEDGFWSRWLPEGRAHFGQSPFDKESFIERLQREGKRVVMVGDGLNDAGALRRADVGLAVSEEYAAFSPASDGILAAARLNGLPLHLRAAAHIRYVTGVAYAFALLYNVIGLSFAVSGTLSPVVAAILMPLSSLTVVGIACAGGWWVYRHDIYHRGA